METMKDLLDQGVMLLDQKHDAEALLLFERATQLDATNAIAWSGRGAAAFKLQRYDDALAAFERAVAYDPAKAEGWSNLCAVLWAYGVCECQRIGLNGQANRGARDRIRGKVDFSGQGTDHKCRTVTEGRERAPGKALDFEKTLRCIEHIAHRDRTR